MTRTLKNPHIDDSDRTEFQVWARARGRSVQRRKDGPYVDEELESFWQFLRAFRERHEIPEIDASKLPRSLDGKELAIEDPQGNIGIAAGQYTEGGWFGEAREVTITDGERTAIYVPKYVVQPKPKVRKT